MLRDLATEPPPLPGTDGFSGRPLRIVVHDVSGHPFQVQLSRKLAARGHSVLHLFFESFQSPRGNVERMPSDPATFAIEGIRFERPFSKYNLLQRRADEIRYGK